MLAPTYLTAVISRVGLVERCVLIFGLDLLVLTVDFLYVDAFLFSLYQHPQLCCTSVFQVNELLDCSRSLLY